ncbi:hypothetical protein F5X98DRAFT_9408 [Xylaria grammica]|nr:hypothetical protein F5X98DRAFT_9408 [Xylaria grammica]
MPTSSAAWKAVLVTGHRSRTCSDVTYAACGLPLSLGALTSVGVAWYPGFSSIFTTTTALVKYSDTRRKWHRAVGRKKGERSRSGGNRFCVADNVSRPPLVTSRRIRGALFSYGIPTATTTHRINALRNVLPTLHSSRGRNRLFPLAPPRFSPVAAIIA